MSERTLESRFARLRASAMDARRRESSRRWSARTSRWRVRLFCLMAEEVKVASESRRRESWEMRESRCSSNVSKVQGWEWRGDALARGCLRVGSRSSSLHRWALRKPKTRRKTESMCGRVFLSWTSQSSIQARGCFPPVPEILGPESVVSAETSRWQPFRKAHELVDHGS